MSFMQPEAVQMVMYHIETNVGTEYVPEDVCGHIGLDMHPDDVYEQVEGYLEGSEVNDFVRYEGWYGRLSASGYMDCTDWMGPYATSEDALAAVKEEYECDDNGDTPEDDDEECETHAAALRYLVKGDVVSVKAFSRETRGLTYPTFIGTLLDEAGNSEGWDVVDVLNEKGEEVGIYCFSIDRS
jgi:hypothetical protein